MPFVKPHYQSHGVSSDETVGEWWKTQTTLSDLLVARTQLLAHLVALRSTVGAFTVG